MALDIKPVLPTSAPPPRSEPARGEEASEEASPKGGAKRSPRGSRQRGDSRTRAARRDRAPAPTDPPAEAPPYAGQTKVHISTSILPSLWTQLQRVAEEVAETGASASVSRLLVALFHLDLPRQDDEVVALVRRWRLLRAGAEGDDPYRGERTEKYNLRVYPAQREALEGAAKLLRTREGIRFPQSMIVNALIHFHGPDDAAGAEELLRRFEIALAGGTPAADTVAT